MVVKTIPQWICCLRRRILGLYDTSLEQVLTDSTVTVANGANIVLSALPDLVQGDYITSTTSQVNTLAGKFYKVNYNFTCSTAATSGVVKFSVVPVINGVQVPSFGAVDYITASTTENATTLNGSFLVKDINNISFVNTSGATFSSVVGNVTIVAVPEELIV